MASHEQAKRDHNILDRIEHDFTNHPPASDAVAKRLDMFTALMISVGGIIAQEVPAGREQAVALTKLEECSMWCKAGIARNQEDS